MNSRNLLFAIVFFLFGFAALKAQDISLPEAEKDRFTEIKANVLFGLNQPLLGGFNMEGNLFYKRLAFDYSHGISLNMDNAILDPVNQAQGIDVHIPWTTGFGVGYRFNDWFNLRVEPKWHKFELYGQGEEQIPDNLLTSYTTFSLGLGAYANWQPFKQKASFLKGVMIAPSIRWWPRISSSLPNNEVNFFSESSQENIRHEAMEVGVNNSPWIVNVSIGYSFGWER